MAPAFLFLPPPPKHVLPPDFLSRPDPTKKKAPEGASHIHLSLTQETGDPCQISPVPAILVTGWPWSNVTAVTWGPAMVCPLLAHRDR